VHTGNLNSGHYVAYAKHSTTSGEEWFYFSDTMSRVVDEREVSNCQAFMLFYKRKNNI